MSPRLLLDSGDLPVLLALSGSSQTITSPAHLDHRLHCGIYLMSLMDFKGMILCCGVLLCGRVVG